MAGKKSVATFFMLFIFVAGLVVGVSMRDTSRASGNNQARGRVFEIRTYTANEGKLDALHARFRNHTIKLFEKHGMTNIGYWQPQDAPGSQNTLIYIIAHPSRDAAKKNWEDFRNDPEWRKVRQESEANGAIVSKVESVFLDATDYSPMK